MLDFFSSQKFRKWVVKKFAISLELNLHHIYIYAESIDFIQMLEINLDHLSMVQSQTIKINNIL